MQTIYADVIVDITNEKLDRVFQYRVPDALQEELRPGMVVKVPFGRGDRVISGYVTGLTDIPAYDPDKMKQILEASTDASGEEGRLVALAAWMKRQYGCTMIQALRTVIPVKKKVREKTSRTVSLRADPVEAAAVLETMKKKHQTARARLLEALLDEPSLPWELVSEKLHITLATAAAMEELGLITITQEKQYRNPIRPDEGTRQTMVMTPEQETVVRKITGEWEEKAGSGHYLIHGITGSGKTFVYMKLIEEAVRRGEQAIVLIPEIALTYQTVLRFCRRFSDRVSFIHSRLSRGERYDQYERARLGKIDVMIGPRSALFTPFPRLGIIVIDEEQEPSYISETMPRYNAREVAYERARLEGARVVLGSATPSLEAYHETKSGQSTLLTLSRRAADAVLPQVAVVDLREELKAGNRSILSRSLQEEMERTLARGEQIMLFLNRRGYAGFVSCRSCGEVIKCPHCDVPLSLHKNGSMQCHYCGFGAPAGKVCPACGSAFLRAFRAGTEQIEEEVAARFPTAKILRMDADTTKGKDAYTKILSSFDAHEADILLGTQMIVKGHDFPDVTLMGILAADLSLNVPDYRAAERTFQLLTQAAGRAGRGDRPGKVLIQTYQPEHYAVECAAMQDYAGFYEQEMEFRLLTSYPPAGVLTAVHISGPDENRVSLASDYLGRFARRAAGGDRSVAVLGPADEVIAKLQDQYRKVLYLKGTDREKVRQIREKLQQYIEMNEGFAGLSIQYEVEA